MDAEVNGSILYKLGVIETRVEDMSRDLKTLVEKFDKRHDELDARVKTLEDYINGIKIRVATAVALITTAATSVGIALSDIVKGLFSGL